MTPTPSPRRTWPQRLATCRHALHAWLLRQHRDQRGEISSEAVLTALLVVLALALAAIITGVVLDWANSIPGPGS